MNLEQASQSLLEQFPGGESIDLARREQMLERFGQIAFGGFGIVLLLAVAGMIYTIVTKMVLGGEQPWAGVLLIAFIIFAVLSLTYVIFNEDLKEKRKKSLHSPPVQPTPDSVVTGKLLDEGHLEPIPTVTENTTDLLPSRNRERSG